MDHQRRHAQPRGELRRNAASARERTWSVVADEVVEEPCGGAHSDWDGAAARLKDALMRHVSELTSMEPGALLEARWAKFEGMGAWREV